MGQLPKPMSNEELAELRRKAQSPAASSARPSSAEEIGYESGIKSLVNVVRRIEALEGQVAELKAKVQKLEAQAPATSASFAHAEAAKLNAETAAKVATAK